MASPKSTLDEKTIAKLSQSKKPKILFFDIETSMSEGYYFELYKEGNIVETKSYWYILCFSHKWLDEKRVYSHALIDHGFNPKKPDDWPVVEKLWSLFNEADVVVAHNGDKFDIRKAYARFAVHGIHPPSPFRAIDTRKIAKKYFGFDSNKLDDLGRQLKLGRKLATGGFELWLRCMKGDREAWKKMVAYNRQDVRLLEAVYLRLRGYHKTHPNLSFYTRNRMECTVCLSKNVKKDGIEYYRGAVAQRWQCNNCGKHWIGPKVAEDRIETYNY